MMWVDRLPPPPPHLADCDRTEPFGAVCAACRLLEIEAWNRWVALFTNVPVYIWCPQGMGRG